MTFNAHKNQILNFYDKTNTALDEHKHTFGELLTLLNKKTGVTQTLNTNLDEFMEHSFTDFNTFRNELESNPLEDSIINYVYDINKNEYLDATSLPDKNIVTKQLFTGVLMGHELKLQNGTPLTYLSDGYGIIQTSFKDRTYISNKSASIESDTITKKCNCNNQCDCGKREFLGNTNGHEINSKKETTLLEIWIDDYLNIYIPKLKTYLVSNYSKYPAYSFFINQDKLNLYHNYKDSNGQRPLIFNSTCPGDLVDYNLLKTFVESYPTYDTSKDKRIEYKTLFHTLLKFYHYEEKQVFFSQYQTLSEKLEQLCPSATKSTTLNEDSMDDEKKIFAQSQCIRELEVYNSKQAEEIEYLRSERTKFIDAEHISSIKLTEYNALLEELNTQLHQEIDKTSIQQKEIIKWKTMNLESSEIKTKCRKMEDTISSMQSELDKQILKITEFKTNNSTLIDKQLETQQKLVSERKENVTHSDTIKELRLKIEQCDINIKELEKNIENEKEQHIITKTSMDEIISNIKTTEQPINDQYQEILLNQLKDKNEEINVLETANKKANTLIETKNKEFDKLKAQVSSLFK
jgi:hypothetical protein